MGAACVYTFPTRPAHARLVCSGRSQPWALHSLYACSSCCRVAARILELVSSRLPGAEAAPPRPTTLLPHGGWEAHGSQPWTQCSQEAGSSFLPFPWEEQLLGNGSWKVSSGFGRLAVPGGRGEGPPGGGVRAGSLLVRGLGHSMSSESQESSQSTALKSLKSRLHHHVLPLWPWAGSRRSCASASSSLRRGNSKPAPQDCWRVKLNNVWKGLGAFSKRLVCVRSCDCVCKPPTTERCVISE